MGVCQEVCFRSFHEDFLTYKHYVEKYKCFGKNHRARKNYSLPFYQISLLNTVQGQRPTDPSLQNLTEMALSLNQSGLTQQQRLSGLGVSLEQQAGSSRVVDSTPLTMVNKITRINKGAAPSGRGGKSKQEEVVKEEILEPEKEVVDTETQIKQQALDSLNQILKSNLLSEIPRL